MQCIYYHANYASAVLAVVILSARLFVTCVLCKKPNNALRIFWYHHMKGAKDNHSNFLTPTVVCGWRLLPSEICAQTHSPPSKTPTLKISACNFSTVTDSEKVQLWWIESRTSFPTSYRWSAYVAPKSPKGWLKKWLFCFTE